MAEESGNDLLYLLGHLAWRLVQAVAVAGAAILALMLAMPNWGDTKEKAYLASMKNDLRNLVTAQEAYFVDHIAYAAAVDQLRDASRYWPSTGVTVVIDQVTAEGWRAVATHSQIKARCAIFVGKVPPLRDQMVQGEPLCWDR